MYLREAARVTLSVSDVLYGAIAIPVYRYVYGNIDPAVNGDVSTAVQATIDRASGPVFAHVNGVSSRRR